MKNEYSEFFLALSNKLRMDIVLLLKDSQMTVGEIVEKLKIEQSKISHALQILKGYNLVLVKIDGRSRIYSLNKKTVLPMLKFADKHIKTIQKNDIKKN